MGRYASGSLNPTFVGLNWGLSQGTVESRVAIAETLADAAAAAVVADALDPEIAAALALDAASITNLAAGEASEGSLAQALRDPEDPELGSTPAARVARSVGAAALVVDRRRRRGDRPGRGGGRRLRGRGPCHHPERRPRPRLTRQFRG